MERNRPSKNGQHDGAVLGVHHDFEVLDLQRKLVVTLVRLESLELLHLVAVLVAGRFGKSSHALLLLLRGELLLVRATLGVCLFVHLRVTLGTKTCGCDVLGGDSANFGVLLLLLRRRHSLLVVLEEEAVRIGARGSLCGEDDGFTRRDTDRISQDKRVNLAVLVLRVGVLDILEASVDDESHAVLQRPRIFAVEHECGILLLQTDAPTNILEEMLLHLRLLGLDDTKSLVVHILGLHTIADILDDGVVHHAK